MKIPRLYKRMCRLYLIGETISQTLPIALGFAAMIQPVLWLQIACLVAWVIPLYTMCAIGWRWYFSTCSTLPDLWNNSPWFPWQAVKPDYID